MNEQVTNTREEQEPLARSDVAFRFSDDPIYHDELTNKLVDHLLTKISPDKEKIYRFLTSRQHVEKSLEELILGDLRHEASAWANAAHDTKAGEKKRISNDQTTKIAFNALADSRLLSELNLDNLTPDNLLALRKHAESALGYLVTDEINLENSQSLQILSPKSINAITLWYAQHAYLNLEKTLTELSDQSDGEQKIRSLAILGFLLGYLDDSHQGSHHNQTLLRRYVNGELPRVIRERLSKKDDGPENSPRLGQLKRYWHEVFVQRWVASARLEYDGMGMLTIPDRAIASQTLESDTRSSETRSGAVSQARDVYARTNDFVSGQSVIQDYDRNQARLVLQEQRSRRKLHHFTDELIHAYNPDHKYLVDEHGRAVGHWRALQEKTAHIFEVFVRTGSKLVNPETTKTEEQHLLSQIVAALVQVLESGNEHHRLDVTQMFGTDFPGLAPVEQCSLIIFSCLSLSSRSQKPEKAVYLISHKLQHILNRHSDFTDEELLVQEADWHFSLDEQQDNVRSSRKRLAELNPEGGIISSQSEELEEEIDARHQFLVALERVLKEKRTNTIGIINLVVLLLVVMPGFATNLLGGNPFSIVFSSIGLINIPIAFNYLRSRKAYKKTKDDLRELKLLGEEVEAEVEKITTKHTKRLNRIKMMFVTALLASALFLPSLGLGLKLVAPDGIDSIPWLAFMNNEDLGTFQIPDQLNQDGLRSLEHQLRGTIYHLPENFSGYYGEPIGYQAGSWLRPGGGEYSDSETTPFTSVQFVNELNAQTHEADANELVYEIEHIGNIVYPLDGYEIVKVYQVGGPQPEIGTSGNLYYHGERPERLLLVTRARTSHALSQNGEVRRIDGVSGVIYVPWNGWEEKYQRALELNQQLAEDPALQTLHSQMLNEANTLVLAFNAGQLNNEQMLHSYSDLATRYSILFAQYVNTNRVYSLLYEEPNLEGSFSILRGIASQPNAGYYCSVGNISFQDFMLSIDIHVLSKPGAGVRNYDGELLSRIGHLNSAVLLPNGEMLFTDMTPYRPNPGEDLSALNEIPPDKNKANPLETVAKIGGALVIASGTYVVGKEIHRRRKRAFESRIDGFLPEDELEADQVLKALEHVLLYILEVSNEEKASNLIGNSFHPDRQALLLSLASDAISMISSERVNNQTNSAMRDMLIGYAKRLKESKRDSTGLADSGLIAKINKENRRTIAQDLAVVWKEIKNQRKLRVEQLIRDINQANQDIEALRQESLSEEDYNKERERLLHQMETGRQKIARVERCSQSLRSVLKLLYKAGS